MSTSPPGAVAYHNGRWIEPAQLQIGVDDLGFLLGATIVERLRTFHGAPFRVDEHMRRLRRSLEIADWNAAPLVEEVGAAIVEFSRRNQNLLPADDDWSVIAWITPGLSADAARPNVAVHGLPLPFAGWAHQFEAGVELCLADVRQIPASSLPPELKCRSRMHYYLADQQARRRRPGSRALLLDQRGFVGEASTANVVAYYADRGLATPRLDGVLPGISQQFLFELAESEGIARSEADMTPEEFSAADEILLCSTSICVQPVTRIDDRVIGAGGPGPVYRRLLARWSEAVGVDVAAQARKYAGR
jgi:branched-subunit amino acid aminotransferase/4-amino-4-deoxychorismate lyase